MPAALGSLSPIRATSTGHDRHGGRSVASASVLDAIDKETRRVIGRICYFFAGSATSCNQQTYKWIRLLGAPHHQVQNQN
uniref:Uncharacterized protein n=1 Tax=Oryza meridionalis TaxID=40149 RepID=A0A0E0C1A2_9ORYZ